MFFSLRRRSSSHRGTGGKFSEDVLACVRVLGRRLPVLGKRYSVQVFTVALAVHLRATLALGVREGHWTEEQVRRLVHSLLRAEDEPPGADMAGPERLPDSQEIK